MTKREILFNGEVFSIEESVIEASLAEMKSRLVDDYSGSGTTIVYDGTTINVDSAKLAAAASNLAAMLNRFAGSGANIVVNGVTYGIDSAKLNSAKESLGGTLGEMAGAVEEEDELQGTWVFNDSVNGIGLPAGQTVYAFNFSSNNITYNQISFMEGNRLRIEDLAYNSTSVYNSTDGWNGEAYKTITITSKLSEVTNGNDLLAWLQTNATKQEESEAESIIGTWVFNDGSALDNLSDSTTPFDVEFMCNGKAYGSMKCDEDSGGEGMWSLYYVKTPTNIDEAYGWGIGWYDQTYRTINITSEPTDETFIAWLKANATKQTAVEPEVPEEPTEDELAGTWVFNSYLSKPYTSELISYGVDFNSNRSAFFGMYIVSDDNFTGKLYYSNNNDDYLAYTFTEVETAGRWSEEEYRTITITSEPTDTAFIDWLKANATKQGAANLITFTIDGTSYQAEDEMTWGEWCDSDYNTTSFAVSGTYVTNGNGIYIVDVELFATFDDRVLASDSITPSFAYYATGSFEPT